MHGTQVYVNQSGNLVIVAERVTDWLNQVADAQLDMNTQVTVQRIAKEWENNLAVLKGEEPNKEGGF